MRHTKSTSARSQKEGTRKLTLELNVSFSSYLSLFQSQAKKIGKDYSK
jgi:hypothetical protein